MRPIILISLALFALSACDRQDAPPEMQRADDAAAKAAASAKDAGSHAYDAIEHAARATKEKAQDAAAGLKEQAQQRRDETPANQ